MYGQERGAIHYLSPGHILEFVPACLGTWVCNHMQVYSSLSRYAIRDANTDHVPNADFLIYSTTHLGSCFLQGLDIPDRVLNVNACMHALSGQTTMYSCRVKPISVARMDHMPNIVWRYGAKSTAASEHVEVPICNFPSVAQSLNGLHASEQQPEHWLSRRSLTSQ